MKRKDPGNTQEKFPDLRKQAEKLLASRGDLPELKVESLEDAQRLITELQVHQIELEMQNDELRKMQELLEVERGKYADLYNFAPVAYFIFDDRDIILDLNLAAAELIGSERKYLVGHPLTAYVNPESIQVFVEHRRKALERSHPQTCELTIRRRDGVQSIVQVLTVVLEDKGEHSLWRSVMTNITERKKVEEELNYQAGLLGSVSDAIIATDAALRIVSWNKHAEFLYGWSAAEVIGQHIDELCRTEFIGQTQAEAHAKFLAENVWRGELRQRRRDGSMLWVTASVSKLSDARGNFIGGVTINHEITERKRNENIIQARFRITEFSANHSSDELLQNTLDELCMLTDSPIGFFHFVEPDQKTLSLQAWSTRTLQEFCSARGGGQHYDIDQAGVWVDCVRERRPVIHNDYANLSHRKGLPEGHAPVIREMVFPIMRHQKIVAIIGVGNKPLDYTGEDAAYASRLADLIWDITERKRADESLRLYVKEIESLHEQMREQAIRDPLTGLYNRRHMKEVFTCEFSRAEREGYTVSIIMLDMDDLKRINDTHGHHIGDRAIQTFASEILSMIRAEDTICRYTNGDEFVVILNKTIPADALKRVEEWHNSLLKRPMIVEEKSVPINFTAGIAGFPMHGKSVDEVVNHADIALYRAKAQGRGRTLVFEQTIGK